MKLEKAPCKYCPIRSSCKHGNQCPQWKKHVEDFKKQKKAYFRDIESRFK